MLFPIVIILIALIMICFEKSRPGRSWPQVSLWWLRAGFLNGLQAGTVFLAGLSWDRWMIERHHGALAGLSSFWGGIAGYLVITFVFYWWHRLRHSSDFLWRWFHQMHHSPQRLEIITAFYKHPFELVADSILCSAILYIGLGLSPAAAANAVLLSGLAELFYHWNIKTPYWLGFIFQRPESHCVHHQDGVHAYNYADLPLWDMLFGTFRNPRQWNEKCGLGENEHRFAEILAGRDVTKRKKQNPAQVFISAFLVIFALLQMTGDLCQQNWMKAIGAAWGASPAPKVFSSAEGLETFSSQFFLIWEDQNGVTQRTPLTPKLAKRMKGPYNRRNVYGAILSYGPLLAKNEALRDAYESILNYAICRNGPLLKELGINAEALSKGIIIEVAPRMGNDYSHLELFKEVTL